LDVVNIHIKQFIENSNRSIDQVGVITLDNMQLKLVREKLLNKYLTLGTKSFDDFQGGEK